MSEETATVSFQVIGVEIVRGRGRLLGFAAVVLEIGGVEIRLQGVQIVRADDGSLKCLPPTYKHLDGRWLPSVVLPPDLSAALATEILRRRDPRD